MQYTTIKISLSLKGPLLTQSSNPGELGLDTVVARHKDKTPYLPGTLITGKLRQALEELQSISDDFKADLEDWLGSPNENNHPKNKRLYLSDFDLNTDDISKLETDQIRDRITVDKSTGAVKEQHIVMMENPFMSGETYTFTGELHFFAPKANNILDKIKTGFNWFSQLGAMKSIGFGQITDVIFDTEQSYSIKPPSTPQQQPAPKKIGLKITPLYPICISSKPKTDNNLFESEAIIPGAAIIGSIATTWNHLLGKTDNIITEQSDSQRQALCENFSKIRISHAFPTEENEQQRPVVAPLSLVKIELDKTDPDIEYYDVSQLSSPCLINKEPPDFALDWKKNNAPQHAYPWPYIRLNDWGWKHIETDLRVRTRIDPSTKRSKKADLFAYEQILPTGNSWLAELDLSRIDESERSDAFAQLQNIIEYGIIGLGKTNTPAKIGYINNPKPIFDTAQINQYEQWLVTLQTDTLLGTPEQLNETSGAKELEAMYKSAWEILSNENLELVHYFTRQKLSGGKYRHHVFQGKDKLYRPWLLTEAGSTFVLKAKQGKNDIAKKLLQEWQYQGLPLAKDTLEYYSISKEQDKQWKTCPFTPQNGYGEIAVNIAMPENIMQLNDDDKQQVTPIPNMQEEV